ncbi:uncharacterized protein LOC125945520 [Dermacentor silvarum]|uniref:uncharacterized protein LOC125945520 n=1 Tax=Dermacentor silvarum TaxID=543639 RepID=UPI002101D3D3|nr:uncharacterized protein LOC125945520 [Dermacentor silvarum]
MRFALAVLWAWLTQLYHLSDGVFITDIVPVDSLGDCLVNGETAFHGREYNVDTPCERWFCRGPMNKTHGELVREPCRKPEPPNRYCRIIKRRARFPHCCPRRKCRLDGWSDEKYE